MSCGFGGAHAAAARTHGHLSLAARAHGPKHARPRGHVAAAPARQNGCGGATSHTTTRPGVLAAVPCGQLAVRWCVRACRSVRVRKKNKYVLFKYHINAPSVMF